MKPPRLDGFDPNYKSHSPIKPEKVHLESIASIGIGHNEQTKDATLPINPSTEAPTTALEASKTELPSTPALKRIVPIEPTIDHTPPSTKRGKERLAFDFYADQLDKLRRMKVLAESKNQYFSMATHVRQALDEYLTKIPV